MPLKSWQTRSFLIELKPRSEFASLFVDCPPADNDEAAYYNNQQIQDETTENKETVERKEMIHFREHSIEVSSIIQQREDGAAEMLPSYWAKFGDLTLYPNSVCALTWADNHRLFMCKVRVIVGKCPLVPKTFHQLAVGVLSGMLLDEYIENAETLPVQAECSGCSATLLNYSEDSLKLQSLPEDGWLNTSPSMEYFCRDTCGAVSHSHAHHGAHSSDLICAEDAQKQWLPNEQRIVISDSYFLVLKKMIISNAVTVDESNVVLCAKCSVEIGIILKITFTGVFVSRISCNLPNFSLSRKYCGTMSSLMKYDPFSSVDMSSALFELIWLLDSYVVISQGELAENEGEEKLIYSFPALKMLYKIFDAESAKTDPRANGEDASVGILDIPLTCCIKLTEMLLESSLALPPTGRSVGQFYVRFNVTYKLDF
ncbi:unnamed protein product [Onchocerca ochengi]|uniref:E3 ubiquitin-protein ligase E3D n=1 Tax=Onchocerca ochengi TaxID=42157 RepID=A0A182E3V6_ONCOC|nr:unnamed protein product [Onchocerca ochengi]